MAEFTPNEYDKVYLASGYVHPELAEGVAQEMGIVLGPVARKQFPNSELYARYEDSVRGKHVVIMQSHAKTAEGSVNDAIWEQLLMVDAAKSSSAAEITVVCPNMGYSRQDRKAKGREPISARVFINQLASTGVDRIVAVDLHSPQTQAIFNGPFDHLTAQPLLRSAVRELIAPEDMDKCVVVAPDAGSAKMADYHRNQLGLGIVHMTKSRDRNEPGRIVRDSEVPGVEGRTCVLFDDIIDTAGTLQTAAEALKNSGADKIYAAATHGVFSGPAFSRLKDSPIDRVLVTDTLPMAVAQEQLRHQLKVVSVAPMLARALHEIITDGSVSEIFNDQNHI